MKYEVRGLNAKLNAFIESQRPTRLFLIHAGLPLVSVDDIAALIADDAAGCALASDRHSTGTNALALVCNISAKRRHLLDEPSQTR
jgi:2-phospho-L-lactate guanylyltransferase